MAKDIRKTIRFSKDEFAQIQEKLNEAQISFSDFARSAILRKKIKMPIEREMIFQVNKIENNLNRIAEAVNGRDDKIQILSELVEIEKAVKNLL